VKADTAAIKAKTDTMTNAPDASTVAGAVRTELATELGRLDVAVSTRSTLTAEDIPEGLTAAEVWANPDRTLTETAPSGPTAQDIWEYADRTLTETAGLTPEQSAQLDAVAVGVDALPTLTEIEASTVLAKDAAVQELAEQVGTPAQAGAMVEANMVQVNGVAVAGTGSDADPWGPA
jgi:hypothetical protein